MDTATVVKIREELRKVDPVNNKIKIICDNMIVINEKSELVIWDDAHSNVYVFRPNKDPVTSDLMPIEIIGLDYSVIQYLRLSATPDNFKTFADTLISRGLMTEQQKEITLKHCVFTTEDFVK